MVGARQVKFWQMKAVAFPTCKKVKNQSNKLQTDPERLGLQTGVDLEMTQIASE